jgi:outer membrane receptor protein involved in Fe transport
MRNLASFALALLCSASVLGLASTAYAQSTSENAESVTVTGSRVVTSGVEAPTPVTVLAADQLLATTPTNIPDGLFKLPVFAGRSGDAGTVGNVRQNANGNFLNLRNLGIGRTLILQDGRRVPATSVDGLVDVNILPEMLLQRVDVVTGGVSAVYGSDAITGVVNFITDTKYEGVKTQVQGGISSRGDGASWKFGVAAGHTFGNLHVEVSYEHLNKDPINNNESRPSGAGLSCATGAGTAANPFTYSYGCRLNIGTFGGLILSGPLAGYDFASNGVLSPVVRGQPTGSASLDANVVGGDLEYSKNTSLTASLKSDQAFARADYSISPGLNAFVEGSYAHTFNGYNEFPQNVTNVTVPTSNPFLVPAFAGLPPSLAMAAQAAGSFTLSRYVIGDRPLREESGQANMTATAGISGEIGRFNWDAFYTYGNSIQRMVNVGSINNGRMEAALDAVANPANGQIVCRVTLTNPGLYPGCVPLNLFGPTAQGQNGITYVAPSTSYKLKNRTDDFGANIVGDLFDFGAGPVRAALSGEYRTNSISNRSTANPSDILDCTGLRFGCVPGRTLVWQGNNTANVDASEDVAEVALEATAPLVKDIPLVRSLALNGAVRYANYSISGDATTWKVGADWQVVDDVRLRGTRSRDFRAPNLFELFQPLTGGFGGFTDIHTSTTGPLVTQRIGNPNLVPETGDTWTGGVVYQPGWMPGFSVSVDYYDIKINNGIATVAGGDPASEAACEASNGTSPFCSLVVRPLPFSDHTPANFPTINKTQPLNLAKTWTNGVDTEVNYAFDLDKIDQSLGGSVNTRLLVTYQPILKSVVVPGQPIDNYAGFADAPPAGLTGGNGATPKWKVALMVGYQLGSWDITWQTRWRDALKPGNGNPAIIWNAPRVPAVSFSDVSVTRDITIGGTDSQIFVSADNVFDTNPPVYPNGSLPGYSRQIVIGDDIMGRYVTVGLRMNL